MTFRLGVDVGGTFTDLLLVDESSGHTYMAKVPSTPEDSSIGVLNGIDRICDESDINARQVNQVMHGTTVATNAVLTRKGASVGLITTKGYRQVLQVARSYPMGTGAPRHGGPMKKWLLLLCLAGCDDLELYQHIGADDARGVFDAISEIDEQFPDYGRLLDDLAQVVL